MILAAAVPAGVANTVVYPAGFYTQFAPNSAADMVRQTPGFTIQEGADRRGFSGSGGNVLIDGERPSAKSATLESLLAQIPAAQVDRIELIRGGEQAGTGATQSVLLNVVRRRASGKGAWGANIRYSEKGDHASPQASATWSGPTAAGELTLSASRTYDFGP
ncbi:MAG: TonB-dependent receptor plug domain-containing protein, partial [Caulobacteraceae bacterium]